MRLRSLVTQGGCQCLILWEACRKLVAVVTLHLKGYLDILSDGELELTFERIFICRCCGATAQNLLEGFGLQLRSLQQLERNKLLCFTACSLACQSSQFGCAGVKLIELKGKTLLNVATSH